MSMLKAIKRKLGYLTLHYDPKRYWNEKGEFFYQNRRHDEIRKIHRAQEAFILKSIKRLDPRTILEVGCGYGRILSTIHRTYPSIQLTGIDISETLLRKARSKLPKEVRLALGDIRKLDFKDGEFDLVITCKALQHVQPKDIRDGIKEILRVSKTNVLMVEDQKRRIGPNIFSHDYKELLKQNGATGIEEGKILVTTVSWVENEDDHHSK